jgi:hypothetical protein
VGVEAVELLDQLAGETPDADLRERAAKVTLQLADADLSPLS